MLNFYNYPTTSYHITKKNSKLMWQPSTEFGLVNESWNSIFSPRYSIQWDDKCAKSAVQKTV